MKKKLHAKLYLIHRPNTATTGFLGSSNLTQSGLDSQEELNIEVVEASACDQLQNWFNERWEDKFCIDISEEFKEVVLEVIDDVNRATAPAILVNQPSPPIAPVVSRVASGDTENQQEKVSLLSDVQVDYTRLCDFLTFKDWNEADKETARLMMKVIKRQEEGGEENWEAEEWDEKQSRWQPEDWDERYMWDTEWDEKTIAKFPCTDLRTIDQLWVKHSNGRFGFSVQKKIWQEVEQNEDKFLERVGWQVKGTLLIAEEPQELIWKLTTGGSLISANQLRKGFLPLRVPSVINEIPPECLFSRLEACKI